MPIGNTPKHETNIAVEYGKSFSFGVWLRDKDDKHLDLTGVKLRFVARKQPRHRGTVVIEKVAIPAHGANWMQHFEFQADDLALPPGEYPYDITLEAKDGYSTPLVKGYLIIGANADDYTNNVYPENSGMTTDITVQIRHRDVVKITVERVDGMFKYVQQMIHDFRIYLGNQKDKFDADVKKVVDYYDDIVRLINTKVFVIKEGYHHENPGPGPGTEDIMPGSLYFDLDDDYPLLPASVLPDGSSMPQDSVLSLDANHLPHWSDIHSQLAARVAAALPTSAAFNPGTTYHSGDVVLYQGKLFQAKTDTSPGQTPDSNPGKWLSLDLGHVAALAAHALTQAEADNLYVPKSQVKIVDTLPAATGLVDDTLIFLVPAVTP